MHFLIPPDFKLAIYIRSICWPWTEVLLAKILKKHSDTSFLKSFHCIVNSKFSMHNKLIESSKTKRGKEKKPKKWTDLGMNTNHIIAILSLPINLLYSLYTALVLISDDFHSIFPPYPQSSPFPVSHPLWWHSSNSITWRHCYRVFIYIYSLLIEKNICDCQNISISFRVFVCAFSSGDLFIFW